jgi:predicted enzyme related to lactoylglutathione lyase
MTRREEFVMADPVVHFEIIGEDPARLRDFYARLFGWSMETGAPVAPEVSEAASYAFVSTPDGATGVPGGIGGGPGFRPHTVFYVGVPDVEAALTAAEALGGSRVMGPVRNEQGGIVVGHLSDPEGNMVGVAGPA